MHATAHLAASAHFPQEQGHISQPPRSRVFLPQPSLLILSHTRPKIEPQRRRLDPWQRHGPTSSDQREYAPDCTIAILDCTIHTRTRSLNTSSWGIECTASTPASRSHGTNGIQHHPYTLHRSHTLDTIA